MSELDVAAGESNVVPITPPVVVPPNPDDLRMVWDGLLKRLENAMYANQRSNGSIGQHMSIGQKLVDWCVAEGFDPKALPDDFRAKFKAWRESAIASPPRQMLAVKILDLFLSPDEIEKTMPPRPSVVRPPAPARAAPPPPPESDEEEFDEEEGDEEPEAVAQPAQNVPTVRVQVDAPRARASRSPRAPVQPRGTGLLPQARSKRVDVFRRDPNGHQSYIDQYDAVEVESAGGIYKFLRDYVNPDYSDPSGQTTYEVYEVINGKRNEQGIQFNIESPPQENPNDQINQLRNLADFAKDLSGRNVQGGHDALDLAKQRIAAAGGQGGMSDIIMLFMLQQMADKKGDTADDLKKLAEMVGIVKPSQQGIPIGPVPTAAMPLAPPPPDELKMVMAKLLEKKIDEKPPEPKGTVDFLKEIVAVRELFAPREDPAMKVLLEEIKELRKAQGTPQTTGTLTEAVKQVAGLKQTFQEVAPMFKLDGFSGMIGGLISNPQVATSFAQFLSAAAQKMTATPAQPVPAQAQQQDPSRIPVHPQPMPQQTQPAPQQRRLPQAAEVSLRALQNAKEEKEQLGHVLQALKEITTDPAWADQVNPRIEAMMKGDVQPVRGMIAEVTHWARKDLVTNEFVDKVLKAMITEAIASGFTLPESVVALVKEPAPKEPTPSPAPAESAPTPAAMANGAAEESAVVATVTG